MRHYSYHRFLLFLLALACLVACGQDSSTGAGAGSGSVALSQNYPAQIRGFVYQRNPVFILGDEHDAPGGSSPRTNALVVARDPLGNVVGASMTNGSGEFMLAGLPQGLVTLEARVDPASSQPDTSALMTAVSGMLMRPHESFPVNREKAIDIVRSAFPPSALVAATLNPLPAGSEVTSGSDEGYAGKATSVRLGRPAWLFFINSLPRTAYAHPVQYLLVDAQSGEVETLEADFYPLVNGAPLWSTDSDLFDFRALQDIEDPTQIPPGFQLNPLPEVVQLPPGLRLTLEPPPLARLNTEPESVFAVVHSGGRENAFDWEAFLFARWLQSQGVPRSNIRIVTSQNNPGQIVLSKLRRAVELTKAAMIARGNQNPPLFSTMIYYHTAHGGPEKIRLCDGVRTALPPDSIPLRTTPNEVVGGDGSEMTGLRTLTGNPACRVRYIFDSCQSGPFIASLIKFLDENSTVYPHDVIAYSATDGNNFTGYEDTYTQNFVRQARIFKADIDLISGAGLGGAPSIFPPLSRIRTNGTGKRQNPQVFAHIGKPEDICPEPLPPRSPPTPPDDFAKPLVEVSNWTDAPMSMKMGDSQPALVVDAGKSVQQELSQPVKGMNMESLQVGPIKVPFLDLHLDVSEGVLQRILWVESGGVRTMIVAATEARPMIPAVNNSASPSPSSSPTAGADCARVILRNRSGVPVTFRFTATSPVIRGGNLVTLNPGQEFLEATATPIDNLDLVLQTESGQRPQGFQFDVACGQQQVFVAQSGFLEFFLENIP